MAQQNPAGRPRILVGKDTRISGDMLESALIAGICSTGADVLTAGIIPTPAVAYLTGKYQANCGIVISASHNPVEGQRHQVLWPGRIQTAGPKSR